MCGNDATKKEREKCGGFEGLCVYISVVVEGLCVYMRVVGLMAYVYTREWRVLRVYVYT